MRLLLSFKIISKRILRLRLLRSKRENMKIGQRVSVTGKQGSKEFNDHRGIIVGQDTPIYCIEFDDFIHGHAGIDNKNKEGHCWWVYKDLITLIDWDFSKFNKEFVVLLKELANCGWEVGYPIEEKDAWDYSDNTGKCKNFKAKEGNGHEKVGFLCRGRW